jgi:hypothetical protein
MSVPQPVELEIDFRSFANPPRSPQAFASFWDELSARLAGRPLTPGMTQAMEHPRDGILRLTVISLPPGGHVIGPDARFAVHSILEPPRLKNFCTRCEADSRKTHGAYTCLACEHERRPERVCEDHVVILEGGMRLDARPRATCDLHVPNCECGQRAFFWCGGPLCGRRVAWCERHRRQHPNDPETAYCLGCYAEVFPECSFTRCDQTGTGACEYVAPDGSSCGRKVCSLHLVRWQIYGPHKLGLGLCGLHRNVAALGDDQLLFQVTAATAIRKLREPRARHDLPSLQSIRHILLKARSRAYDIMAVNSLFVTLAARVGQQNQLERTMSELLRHHAKYRAANIERDQSEKQLGLQIFERLKAQLRLMGLSDVADQIIFSDYRPKSNILFVHLREDLRRHMIGRGGIRIKQLREALGANITFEQG